jgi:hypothetical protein
MTALLVVLAVLVPGIPMDEQPYLPHPSTDPMYELGLLAEAAEARLESLEPEPEPEPVEEPETPAPAPPQPAPEPEPTPAPPASERNVWDRLAECESGLWVDGGASFVEGSARWDYEYGRYLGGLQFDQPSWDWASEVGGHGFVGVNPATVPREVQIQHAETLLAIHPAGWGAWPTCSRLLGLR